MNDPIHWVKAMIVKPEVNIMEPSVNMVTFDTWHRCMAHANKNIIKNMSKNTDGFDKSVKIPSPGCTQGKMHNKSFPESIRRAAQPLELLHADLLELPLSSTSRVTRARPPQGTVKLLHKCKIESKSVQDKLLVQLNGLTVKTRLGSQSMHYRVYIQLQDIIDM